MYGVDFFDKVTQHIQQLVERRDSDGSSLEIGIGALTSPIMADGIPELVDFVGDELGVDWIQFRPNLIGFDNGELHIDHNDHIARQLQQAESTEHKVKIIRSRDRYEADLDALSFDRYHAAHFLLTVAVDGTSWLGTECKEDRRWSLGNVYRSPDLETFLTSEERTALIDGTNSTNYPNIGARTRCTLMSNFIQGLADSGELPDTSEVEHQFLL